MLHLAEMWSRVLIFTDFERWIFKIGIFRRSKIFTPIDSPHRELQIRFLSVKNGFELIVLRSDEVDVFFRPLFFFFKKCNTLYCNAHYEALDEENPPKYSEPELGPVFFEPELEPEPKSNIARMHTLKWPGQIEPFYTNLADNVIPP